MPMPGTKTSASKTSEKRYVGTANFLSVETGIKVQQAIATAPTKAPAKKQNYKNLFLADSFDNAVKIAYYSAKPQGTVLLSPACASFDCFNGYHERGQRFIEIFEELKNESN